VGRPIKVALRTSVGLVAGGRWLACRQVAAGDSRVGLLQIGVGRDLKKPPEPYESFKVFPLLFASWELVLHVQIVSDLVWEMKPQPC